MSIFQLLMLGASAFFAYRIYEHIQTLQDPQNKLNEITEVDEPKNSEAFSPFDSSTLIDKADEARENDDLDKAVALYREANIKEPKNEEVLFFFFYTLAQLDRDDEALEYLLESIAIDNDNPFAYEEISKVYAKLGDEVKATEYHEKAKALDEDI